MRGLKRWEGGVSAGGMSASTLIKNRPRARNMLIERLTGEGGEPLAHLTRLLMKATRKIELRELLTKLIARVEVAEL
jgi:hypothetical protein